MSPRPSSDVWGLLAVSLGSFGLAALLLDRAGLAFLLLAAGALMLYRFFT